MTDRFRTEIPFIPDLSDDEGLTNLLGNIEDVTVQLHAPHRVLLFVLGLLSTISDPSGIIEYVLAQPIVDACKAFDRKEAEQRATQRSASSD